MRPTRHRRAAAILGCGALLGVAAVAGATSGSGLGAEPHPPPGIRATAPRVVGTGFDDALERLRSAGFRVAVPAFPPLPGAWIVTYAGLDAYVVSAQRGIGTRTVRLTLRPLLQAIGSPAIPPDPTTTTVPSFVGMSYAAAIAAPVPGLYVRFGHIGPLRPASSVRGLDAFVVKAQSPRAGTLVPAYGARSPNGVNLGPSTVTLSLGVRGPGGG
jgi:hypothetical protein